MRGRRINLQHPPQDTPRVHNRRSLHDRHRMGPTPGSAGGGSPQIVWRPAQGPVHPTGLRGRNPTKEASRRTRDLRYNPGRVGVLSTVLWDVRTPGPGYFRPQRVVLFVGGKKMKKKKKLRIPRFILSREEQRVPVGSPQQKTGTERCLLFLLSRTPKRVRRVVRDGTLGPTPVTRRRTDPLEIKSSDRSPEHKVVGNSPDRNDYSLLRPATHFRSTRLHPQNPVDSGVTRTLSGSLEGPVSVGAGHSTSVSLSFRDRTRLLRSGRNRSPRRKGGPAACPRGGGPGEGASRPTTSALDARRQGTGPRLGVTGNREGLVRERPTSCGGPPPP